MRFFTCYANVLIVTSSSPGDQECSFPGFGTLDCNAGDVLNPLYFYTLHAIKNFHDWIMRIYHAIGDGQQEVVGLSTQMTLDFVQTEVPVSDYQLSSAQKVTLIHSAKRYLDCDHDGRNFRCV